MKRMIAILWVLALQPAAAWAQEWRTYTYPDPGFSIEFPGDPRVQPGSVRNSTGVSLPMTRYTARQQGLICSVSVVDYTSTNADPLSTIAETVRSMRAAGKVTAESGARIRRIVGRDLTVEAADGSLTAIAIFFFERHLYTVTGQALPPDAAASVGEATRCRDSLQFPGNEGGFGGLFGGGGGTPARTPARAKVGRVTTDAACAGKAPGDAVQLRTPGGPVPATCTLVAQPDPPSSGPPP